MTTDARDTAANAVSRAAPLALVGTVDARDPCLYEQISAPWEIIATPL